MKQMASNQAIVCLQTKAARLAVQHANHNGWNANEEQYYLAFFFLHLAFFPRKSGCAPWLSYQCMARREMDVYCNQSSFFGTEFRMCSFESASNTPSYMIATALDEGHILSAYIRALMPRLSGANTSEECIDDLGNRKSLRDKAYIVAVFFYLDVFSLLSEENHLNGARLQ